MRDFLLSVFIKPLSAFLSAVGATPDSMGVFLLAAVSIVLLIVVTVYLVRHKRDQHERTGHNAHAN